MRHAAAKILVSCVGDGRSPGALDFLHAKKCRCRNLWTARSANEWLRSEIGALDGPTGRGVTGSESVQHLDHLRRIHRAPSQSIGRTQDMVFYDAPPSSFLVVDVVPGGEFERA